MPWIDIRSPPVDSVPVTWPRLPDKSEVRSPTKRSGAVISYEDCGEVMADGPQLRLVFQNLIENAIKYAGPDAPNIQVLQQERDVEWVFCVADNGIGVEPASSGQIFDMFSRGRHDSSLPGNGVGLAICKKIIERHGGKIWIESVTGNGSRFFFTIPKV